MQVRRASSLVIGTLWLAIAPIAAADTWPQWGGERRDFAVEARKLASAWGESGPPQLWSRALGGGFSSIVSDGKLLYTHYREGETEIVAALSRTDGTTRWEHRYAAPVPETPALSTEYGKGPNATPLLADGAVVTFGFTGMLHCLDAADGKLRWAHDMTQAHGVKIPYFGHASSALAVGKQIVIVAGGIYAFDLASGALAWKNDEFGGNYASPRLVRAGEKGAVDQIVAAMDGTVVGFDSTSGKTLWSVEHRNQWGTILSSPVLDKRGRVFVSAAGVGSILVDPGAKDEGQRRLWHNEATQIAHSNAVRDGDRVFGSVGDATSFLAATSLEDGEQIWKGRGFAQANLLRVGRQFILLDFAGVLALVELDEKGMRILTQGTINDAPTWTPPTLLDTTIYIRDESRIAAYDLSPKAASK